MKEQLLLLAHLQEIDEQVDRHERNLIRLPQEAQEIARTLVGLRREISEIGEQLGTSEKALRAKERDLATEQEKIKRSEKRLLAIKNQKEHSALSREIKLGKKVVSEMEEAILELMGTVESLKKSSDRKTKEVGDLEENLRVKKAEADVAATEAEKVLGELKQERERLVQSVERDFLKRYDTVKKALGTAMAETFNGSCSACHMALPPQVNIQVLKQEELIICPACRRILYVRPENVPKFNKMQA